MCVRHSMGCVYYMWQLVFVDIINDKTEFYIDIINWTWYIHVMIDIWPYSWPKIWYYNRLISLFFKLRILCHCNTWDILIDVVSYNLLITVLFMLFSYPVYLHDSIIVYSHVICMCTFLSFYTLIGSFWLPGFAHPGIWLLHFVNQVFEEEHTHFEEPEFFLLDHPISVSLLTYSYWFFNSLCFGLSFYSISIIHGILSCVEIICHIAVIFNAFIVDW